MLDREKVINGLREMSCRATWKDIDRIRHKFQPIINDAIAMLKEQESVIEALKSDLDETLAVLGEQPDIVRCRDCKHWRQLYGDKPFYSHIGCCDCDDVSRKIYDCGCYPDFRTDSDWFCADGERRRSENEL